MRIREVLFHNFRSFRGERRISFVDPVTGAVRPVSVLAGSNGSGKTSVFEVIEALLSYVLESAVHSVSGLMTTPAYFSKPDDDLPFYLIRETQDTGLICMTIELSRNDIETLDKSSEVKHIIVGRWDLLPESLRDTKDHLFHWLTQTDSEKKQSPDVYESPLLRELRTAVSRASQTSGNLNGGLLYFPYERRLDVTAGGEIAPPPEEDRWVFRFANSDQWKGSLEQFWVWQNYLDLEQKNEKRDNLQPFVITVENVLGKERPITIRKGRAIIPVSWQAESGETPRVRLDQLPSGEQQCLLLFGELARRRRKGVVLAIDEIENSLHPTLQRLVMWNLRRLAREWDAQAIVATHSLEIINTVRGGAFINLDYPKDRFNLPVSGKPDKSKKAA